MKSSIVIDEYEEKLLKEIENGEWLDKKLENDEVIMYENSAKYTKSLQEKKPVTIRFSTKDLAKIKTKAKSKGIGYQNLIQFLVSNYVEGNISLKI
jgi:predicted DNA binding CopG/RHH family protein